jgi:hypothetical protein
MYGELELLDGFGAPEIPQGLTKKEAHEFAKKLRKKCIAYRRAARAARKAGDQEKARSYQGKARRCWQFGMAFLRHYGLKVPPRGRGRGRRGQRGMRRYGRRRGRGRGRGRMGGGRRFTPTLLPTGSGPSTPHRIGLRTLVGGAPTRAITSVEEMEFDGFGELELAVDGFGDHDFDDYDGLIDDFGARTRNQQIALLTVVTGLGTYLISGMGKKRRSDKKRMETSLMWAAAYAVGAFFFYPRQDGA